MNSPTADRWAEGAAYEQYMGRWSRRVARTFVSWVAVEPGAHWLDVGCGTGALASAICESSRPSSVAACDPSEPFVAHARRLLAGAPVSLSVAGIESLPSREGGFDAVVSGLVLNFIPDPARAVEAMRARLRRRGLLAACVWDYGEGMEFLRTFWDEAAALDASAATLDEGVRFPLCRPEALSSLFTGAGLTHVKTGSLEIATEFDGFDDYWQPFLRGTGPAPAYVASLKEEHRAGLRERLARRLGDRLRLRARAWAVRGIST